MTVQGKDDRVSILVVDDRPENLLALEVSLRSPGYHIVSCLSGRDALVKINEKEFAVILLDVQMPGMDGFEVARLIREREHLKATPIIFLTANSYNDDFVDRAYGLGAIDYLFKPFNPSILRAKVASLSDIYIRSKKIIEHERLLMEKIHLQTKSALAVSETRFRTLFEQASLPMEIYSHDGLCVEANRAWEKLFDSDRRHLQGYNIFEDDQLQQQGLIQYFRRAYAGETLELPAFRYDPQLLGKPGRARWLETYLFPVIDESGRVRELAMILKDITEQKNAQQMLSLQAQVLDNMSEGVSLSNEAGYIVYANPAEERIFGYEPGELIGQHVMVQNSYAPEENKRIVSEVIATLQAQGVWVGEWENIKKDGTHFVTRARISSVVIDKKPHWVCVQEDITQEKKVQQILKHSELRFRHLADAMLQIVWTADKHGVVQYFNDRWFSFTGLNWSQTQDWGWKEVLHPDDREASMAAWMTAVQSGKTFEYEHRFKRGSDGSYRWHLARATAVRDEEGQVVKWFGTATDIHEIKEAQSEIQRALQLRDEFLSIASHELKTPITSLKMQLQMTKRGVNPELGLSPSPERLAKVLDTSDRQIDRLTAIIEDLLDVTRIQAGKLSFNLSYFNLAELIVEVVERFAEQLQAAQCELRLNLDEEVSGHWDRNRLDQVLVNLLSNAIKYAPSQPVEVKLLKHNGWAELSVKDLGPGIALENQEKIFQRFVRAVPARNISGLGLGLFIVRQIVEAHRGEIKIDSEVGQGACFRVELPLQ